MYLLSNLGTPITGASISSAGPSYSSQFPATEVLLDDGDSPQDIWLTPNGQNSWFVTTVFIQKFKPAFTQKLKPKNSKARKSIVKAHLHSDVFSAESTTFSCRSISCFAKLKFSRLGSQVYHGPRLVVYRDWVSWRSTTRNGNFAYSPPLTDSSALPDTKSETPTMHRTPTGGPLPSKSAFQSTA